MGTDDHPAAADQPEPGLAGVCSSFGDLGSAPRILAHAIAFMLGDLFLTAGSRRSAPALHFGRTQKIFFRPRFLILHFFV